MMRVKGLSAAYGSQQVFSDVSFEVAAGDWVVIIGPNGAGKSTLLKAIAGLTPVEGSVELDGTPVANMRARHRARAVAYVPQNPFLPPGMKVFDYVLLGRTPYLSPLGKESVSDVEYVRNVLEQLSVAEFASRELSTLSGGEAQRAVLARALAQDCDLLLLDEPTSALDLGRQQETMAVIDDLRLRRQLTVVMTMHDLTLAGQFGHRLLLLNGGGILAEGTPGDVLTSETIRRHYGAQVRIIDDPDGGVIVVPTRAEPESQADVV